MDTDLCSDCYASWKKSEGKMDICKGHTFCEIPRPCWYTLKPGTVTEDGRTLHKVLDYFVEHFTGLLKDVEEL
jgi:hypothetical protein